MTKYRNYSFPLLILLTTCFLTGCSTLNVASFVTMAFTGKSFSDHALSLATGKDCAVFNLVQGKKVCIYEDSAEITLITSAQVIDDSLMIAYVIEEPEQVIAKR